MDDLERRLLVLELQSKHDREMILLRFEVLSRQLQDIQSRPLSTLSAASLIKILIAVLIPIGVWLVTGDMRKALEASRHLAGAG